MPYLAARTTMVGILDVGIQVPAKGLAAAKTEDCQLLILQHVVGEDGSMPVQTLFSAHSVSDVRLGTGPGTGTPQCKGYRAAYIAVRVWVEKRYGDVGWMALPHQSSIIDADGDEVWVRVQYKPEGEA